MRPTGVGWADRGANVLLEHIAEDKDLSKLEPQLFFFANALTCVLAAESIMCGASLDD